MAIGVCICGKITGQLQPHGSSTRVLKVCSLKCEELNNSKKKGVREKTYGSRAVSTPLVVFQRFFIRLKST